MLGPIPDIPNYTLLGGSRICILNKEMSLGNLNSAHQAGVEMFWHVEYSATWGSSDETESLYCEHNRI